jgi:hypothetical protein
MVLPLLAPVNRTSGRQDHFDAAVFTVGKGRVTFGRILQAEAMGNHERRIDRSGFDVAE